MSKKTAAPQTKASLLTMADLAARFSLPESTARYYCRRFNAFLPQEGKGRRKYTAEAIPVFAAVQEAMRRTRHARSVEMELSLQFPANAPAVKEAAQGVLVPSAPDYHPAPVLQEFSRGILQVLSAQAQALERIADVLSGIERIVPENDAAKPPAPRSSSRPDADPTEESSDDSWQDGLPANSSKSFSSAWIIPNFTLHPQLPFSSQLDFGNYHSQDRSRMVTGLSGLEGWSRKYASMQNATLPLAGHSGAGMSASHISPVVDDCRICFTFAFSVHAL